MGVILLPENLPHPNNTITVRHNLYPVCHLLMHKKRTEQENSVISCPVLFVIIL